jgi:hypothetical protein
MSSKSPRINLEKFERVLNAWTTLAPDKTFGGLTRQQFEAFITASKSARTLVTTLENQLRDALALRQQSDEESFEKLQWIKNGVLGDPENGPDSALYQSMGYVRKSDRKSGLHRTKTLEAV